MLRVYLVCCLLGVVFSHKDNFTPSVTCTDTTTAITVTTTDVFITTSTVTLYSLDYKYKDVNITVTIMSPSTVYLRKTLTTYPELVILTRTLSLTSTIFNPVKVTLTTTSLFTDTCRIKYTNVKVNYVTSTTKIASTSTTTVTSTVNRTETMYRTKICYIPEVNHITRTTITTRFASVNTTKTSLSFVTVISLHPHTVNVTAVQTTSIYTVINQCSVKKPVKNAVVKLQGKTGKIELFRNYVLLKGQVYFDKLQAEDKANIAR